MDACDMNNDENDRFPFPWSSDLEGLLEPNKYENSVLELQRQRVS